MDQHLGAMHVQPGYQSNSSCTSWFFGVEDAGLPGDLDWAWFLYSFILLIILFHFPKKQTFLKDEIVCFKMSWALSAYQRCTETKHSLLEVWLKQYKDLERTWNKWPLKSTPIWDFMGEWYNKAWRCSSVGRALAKQHAWSPQSDRSTRKSRCGGSCLENKLSVNGDRIRSSRSSSAIQCEVEASLGYERLCLKTNKKTEHHGNLFMPFTELALKTK